MSDLPPDLLRLRTVEMYLEYQLQRVRAAIAVLERPTQAEPPAPEVWVLQRIPSAKDRPIKWLHRADCHLAKGATLSREQALLALAEPGVQACDACHADEDFTNGASA